MLSLYFGLADTACLRPKFQNLTRTPTPPSPQHKNIRQNTVHRKESRGCGDLFMWFGGLLHKSSRVFPCTVSSFPKLQAAIGYYSKQTKFLLAPTAIRPVSNPLLSTCGPWENTVLLKCRHPHCVALSFYIMSLPQQLWTVQCTLYTEHCDKFWDSSFKLAEYAKPKIQRRHRFADLTIPHLWCCYCFL